MQEAKIRPKLKKFQENIYSKVKFSDSAVFDYMQAFYVGFQFDKYNFGEECFYHSSDALDTLYNFRVSMIQRYTWYEPFKLTS